MWNSSTKPSALSAEESAFVNKIVNGLGQNRSFVEQLKRSGYEIMRVAWEDTSRTKGSCWGDNITDMTLKLANHPQSLNLIRKPNFADNSFDVLANSLRVPVDPKNPANSVTFDEFLANITKYVPGLQTKGSLLAERDKHLLANSQVCVLPLNRGSVDFGVDIYNYQSHGDPAVLVITVSSKGVAVKTPNGHTTLFHNDNGQEAWFNAARLEDVRQVSGETKTNATKLADLTSSERDANQLLIFQVPLTVRETRRSKGFAAMSSGAYYNESCDMSFGCARETAKMDYAQIRVGSHTGAKYENPTKTLERDLSKPIRVTFQGYIVTDSPNLTDQHGSQIIEMLDHMRKFAVASGSLVLEDSNRLTETTNKKESPFKTFEQTKSGLTPY